MLRVLLVEDHVTVRQGLKLLIEEQPDMEVVGEAGDGAAAMAQVADLEPDIVIMDIAMPGMNGLVATRGIKERAPTIAVVALTRYNDDAYLQELLRAGASGYVLKQSPSAELLHAIRAVAEGGQYLDSTLTARVAGDFIAREANKGRAPASLTDREGQVLRLIAWGHSNKEVAAKLDVSVKTVEVHKANAMRKLALRGRIDIVRYALLQGWLHDD